MRKFIAIGLMALAGCGAQYGSQTAAFLPANLEFTLPPHAIKNAPVSGYVVDVRALQPGRPAALINAYRSAKGRVDVRPNDTLSRIAARHATDLARTGRLSHTGSDGSSLGDRALRGGYRYCYVAENVAQGFRDINQVMAGWMQSPGHRRNMLARDAKEFGLSRVDNHWVLVLGRSGC
ncbi:MAG: CAP domain-containing protein [Pseudomonadota bacterium]